MTSLSAEMTSSQYSCYKQPLPVYVCVHMCFLLMLAQCLSQYVGKGHQATCSLALDLISIYITLVSADKYRMHIQRAWDMCSEEL